MSDESLGGVPSFYLKKVPQSAYRTRKQTNRSDRYIDATIPAIHIDEKDKAPLKERIRHLEAQVLRAIFPESRCEEIAKSQYLAGLFETLGLES